jgi:hypothetical protein
VKSVGVGALPTSGATPDNEGVEGVEGGDCGSCAALAAVAGASLGPATSATRFRKLCQIHAKGLGLGANELASDSCLGVVREALLKVMSSFLVAIASLFAVPSSPGELLAGVGSI